MKKLLGIVVLSLLLCGNAYSEIIEFSKCAHERDNFKFRTDLYEKKSYLIDLSKSRVELVTVLTDSYFKKLKEKHSDYSGQPKYIVVKEKIDSYNEYVVVSLKGAKSDSIYSEKIFDLKSKKIQHSFIYKDPKRNDVSLWQCQ